MKCRCDKEVEKIWREFWKPMVCKRGRIDIGQVKKELYDFHTAMEEVPKVYCHITGSRLSKINYEAEVVIDAADAYQEEQCERCRYAPKPRRVAGKKRRK